MSAYRGAGALGEPRSSFWLDTFDIWYACDYHAYQVLKVVYCRAGPVAPWSTQSGEGEQ